MKNRIVGSFKCMAVTIACLAAFLWGSNVFAITAHAASCEHDNYEWVTLVKATCSKEGKQVMICQDCEEILETESIPKTEHKGKWEKTKEATCTAAGIKSYICKNCGAVIDTEEIPMKSHKYVRRVSRNATCQSPRIIEKECSSCGQVITEQTGNVANHSYRWKVTKAATCLAEGIRTGTCKMCNSAKYESIPPTGKHKYGNWSLKLIKLKGKNIKIIQTRTCKVCKKNTQESGCTTAPFSDKHNHNKYFYKFTKSSGRIVILCPSCHKSVTGKISGGTIVFSKPKKDNSKATGKAWKEVKK